MQPGVKHHSNAIRELDSWLCAQKCFPLSRGMLGGSQLPLTRAPQNPGTNSPFPVRAAPPPPPPKKSLKKQNTLLVMDTRSKTVNLVEVNITELLNTHKILWPQSYQLLSLCILEHHLMVLFCCCETESQLCIPGLPGTLCRPDQLQLTDILLPLPPVLGLQVHTTKTGLNRVLTQPEEKVLISVSLSIGSYTCS